MIELVSMALLTSLVGQTGEDDLTADLGRLTAVDASAGVIFGLQWRQPIVRTGIFRSVGTSFGTPALSLRGRVAIVGSGEGEVRALSVADGALVWRYVHGRPFETHAIIATRAPEKGGDPEETVLLGSRDGWLIALDVRTGELRWRVSVDGDPRAPPLQAGDRLLVTTASNRLLAISLETGEILWSAGRSPPVGLTINGHARAALSGDTVFATFSDGYVEAYKLADGRLLWSRPLSLKGGDFVDADADPIVVDGRLFVASYSDGVYALELQDGRTIWSRAAPAVTSLGAYDGAVVAASADGYVWGLRRKDGELNFRTRLPAGPMSRLVIRRDMIVLTAGEVGLIVLDARSGRPLQATGFGGELAGDPVWVNDDLALLSSSGFLYKLRLGFRGRVR